MLHQKLKPLNGQAMLSVNKALVTQASAAIPVVPLYISLLYKIMKAKGTHEGCIEQMQRLFSDVYSQKGPLHDEEGRIRMDDLEMQDYVQQSIAQLWEEYRQRILLSCQTSQVTVMSFIDYLVLV